MSNIGTPAILNGCILSTNIGDDSTDINNRIPLIVGGRSRSSYERSLALRSNQENEVSNYTSEHPPQPPIRYHSNISRPSRKGDFTEIRSTRNGSKSSSRGNSSRDRIADSMISTSNADVLYGDGGNLVVSLPHTWAQQHRKGNQR